MTREQPLPSESGERFLGENDYREMIDRLEALLLECIAELEYHGVGNSITTNQARAALAKPIAHTNHPMWHFEGTCPACRVQGGKWMDDK